MLRKDLTGQKFGRLTAIEPGSPAKIGKKRKHRTTWICECECGNRITVMTSNLLRGNSTSCGCKTLFDEKYNFVDLTGKIFGFLTVVKRLPEKTKYRGVLWECRCTCGEIVNLPSNSLTSGNNITCRSAKCRKNWHNPRVGEITLSHINSIRQNAIKRNLSFSVTPQYLWELFLAQKRKCVLSGMELSFASSATTRTSDTTASLDRIDNFKGYDVGNVRWIHKVINKMRSNCTDDIFIEWCRKCYLYQYENLRPSFNEYFLMLAFDVSLRSEDVFIKHGAIIVNKKTQHIIGTGYNATLRGSDKSRIDLSDREARRPWMIHAEENAIMNCAYNPLNLPDGAAIFITGIPCTACLQRIANFGITDIYVAKRNGTITDNEQTELRRKEIIDMKKINYTVVDMENIWLKKSCYSAM